MYKRDFSESWAECLIVTQQLLPGDKKINKLIQVKKPVACFGVEKLEFWSGKPGGCVSSGGVESCLKWPVLGDVMGCLVECLPKYCLVATQPKGCTVGCFLQ